MTAKIYIPDIPGRVHQKAEERKVREDDAIKFMDQHKEALKTIKMMNDTTMKFTPTGKLADFLSFDTRKWKWEETKEVTD